MRSDRNNWARRWSSRQVLQRSVLEVGGGDLQSVEHQAGAFALDLASGQQAHDLGERDLDGADVLEKGQHERGVAAVARTFGVECEELFALALVVVAEAVAAHGGRSALCPIHHEVHTLVGQAGHSDGVPLPPSVCWNQRFSGILRVNLHAAISYGQNLEP
jgi:hypothetical protein